MKYLFALIFLVYIFSSANAKASPITIFDSLGTPKKVIMAKFVNLIQVDDFFVFTANDIEIVLKAENQQEVIVAFMQEVIEADSLSDLHQLRNDGITLYKNSYSFKLNKYSQDLVLLLTISMDTILKNKGVYTL